MAEKLPIAVRKNLRELGKDEDWLQRLIYEDPSVLGLGDLEAVSREKRQSSGGRVDIILRDPETEAMYEVELMLGVTDPEHIIRTIEYWDLAKRQYPKREHTAVLIAERITTRFYNVIHLLSLNLPIIGMEVQALDIGGTVGLHFSTILNSYEEPELPVESESEEVDEASWEEYAPATVALAKALKEHVATKYQAVELRYCQHYIAIVVGDLSRYWLRERKNKMTLLEARLDPTKEEEVRRLLDEAGIPVSKVTGGKVTVKTDQKMLFEHPSAIRGLVDLLDPKGLTRRT